MIAAGLRAEVGPPMATQEGAVYVLGKEVDMRTRNIVYGLTMSSTTTGFSWTVDKAFNEYEALNETLKSRHLHMPEFPRRRHFTHFFQFSEKTDYWNAIRDGLQTYFDKLLAEESFRQDPDLQNFLQPASTTPPPLLVALDEPRKCRDGSFEYPMTISNGHLNGRHKLEWSLTKTHAEFVKFDERMRNRFQDKDLPVFPRKRRMSYALKYGSEEAWYKVQSVEIENYLNAILSDDKLTGGSVLEDKCIRELLDINESKLRVATRAARGPTVSASASSSSTSLSEGQHSSPAADAAERRIQPGGSSSSPVGSSTPSYLESSSSRRTAASAPAALSTNSRSPAHGRPADLEANSACNNVRLRLDGCVNFFRQGSRRQPAQDPEDVREFGQRADTM